MKRLLGLTIACLLSVSSVSLAQEAPRQIGINLYNIGPWDPQLLFVDVMKQSQGWLVQDVAGIEWSIDTVEVPTRADGYPSHVPFVQGTDSFRVHTTMVASQPHAYPGGEYTLLFEGTGEIFIDWDVDDLTFTTPNTPHSFQVNPTSFGIHLTIVRSDINDPVRNIRVILPGFLSNYESQPFHPGMLELLSYFSVVRFMKPLEVEESPIQDWSERTTPEDATQWNIARGGMAVEYIADLCNTLGVDAWVTLPYRANDTYVREFARVLRDRLNSDLKIYVEYGNENWNADYASYQYTRSMGVDLGLDADSTRAGLKYAVQRSIEIFDLFTDEFGGDTRLVKVLSAPVWISVGEAMMAASADPSINPGQVEIDALAIAPYFGWELGYRLHESGRAATIGAGEVLDSLEAQMAAEVTGWITDYRTLADSYDVELIAYEGGQALVGFEDSPPNYIDVMHAVNRDDRMRRLYCDFYDIWYQQGGGLFTAFALITQYDRWTAYGLLEHLGQDPATAPKWRAHAECIFPYTTVVSTSLEADVPQTIRLSYPFPNPFRLGTNIRFTVPPPGAVVHLEVFDATGRRVATLIDRNMPSGEHLVPWEAADRASGVYFYRLRLGNRSEVRKLVLSR
ncbi:MAG: T9SS type A sorting domain-containing protein [Rhodothermales bacterium]